MSKPFSLNLLKSSFIAFTAGLTTLIVPLNFVASANQASDSPSQINSTPEQPAPPPAETNRQAPQNTTERSQNESDDDRVYISDVYPEYCRMYFHRRDYVSLFEYRETMYRCLYGPDRGR